MDENLPIPKEESLPLSISEIVSNETMQDVFNTILKSCDEQRAEAMDMYYIFKDMVINSGEFESSGTTKEQLAQLLNTAQQANEAKIRIFNSILAMKTKKDVYIQKNITNNNITVGNRRELIEAIEASSKEMDDIIEVEEQINQEIQEPDINIIDPFSGDFE